MARRTLLLDGASPGRGRQRRSGLAVAARGLLLLQGVDEPGAGRPAGFQVVGGLLLLIDAGGQVVPTLSPAGPASLAVTHEPSAEPAPL